MNTLYRFYAADQLLYVGITVNPGRRLEKHRALQPWWADVARIEMEQHPDQATLRAAEREAIKTEKPLHNIRMNAPAAPAEVLVWTCEICHRPIADHAGYITVSNSEIEKCEAAHDAFDDAHRSGPGILFTLHQLIAANLPAPAHWAALHINCDPDPEEGYCYAIGVERIRSHRQVHSWTAHLLSKGWIQSTDWNDLLARLAGGAAT